MTYAEKFINAQRQIAYNQGQKAHGRQVAKQQAQVRKNRSAEGADTSKGKVHFEGDRSSLNKTQRASMDAMEVLAKALGVQIYVFESEVDESGNHVGANGWYDPSDGSIHIDLYAGNSGKGTMLFTVAHELTHFIKQWSPAKFEVLANFLTKQYTAQGQSISELVEAQQDKAARNGRELDYDAAYEEMVADSMESMLADGSIIEMMAELKQQDKGLWQKIKNWFKDLAGKLRAVVDAYKGVQSDSTEGRMVADMKDMISTMEALYMDALVDASENFDGGVQKITTQESDAVKFCVRDNEPTEFNPDGKSLESLLGDILKTAQSFDGRYLYVGKFTSEFRKIVKKYTEIKDLPVVMNYRDAYLAMESKDNGRYQGDGINYHNLGVDGMVDAINSFDMPDAVMLSKKEGKIELALQGVDRKGNKLLSIVALNTTAQNAKKFIEAHIVTSIYGRRGIENYIKKAEAEGRLVYNKKEESAQGIPQVQYEGDINANSPKPSIRNPELEVKKKFSDRDSVGNQLSEEQQEYFKDSKARDEQGRLLVMYHGTSNGGFTVFDAYGSNFGLFGQGLYFTDNPEVAESYTHKGKGNKKQVYKAYLRITNPIDMDAEADIAKWRKAFVDEDADATYLDGAKTNEDAFRALKDYLADAGYYKYDAWETVSGILYSMCYDGITHIGGGRFNKKDETRHRVYIAFEPEQVKDVGNTSPTSNPDIRFSQRDVGRQEAVTQALEKENAKLREDVAELRELVKLQRQVTNGTKFTKTSVEAAARYLKQNADAKGSTQELMKLLNGLYEYIASGKELTWEGVKEQAQGAADWLWEHIDRRGKRSDYAWENNCHGGSLAAYR